jgi:hypothetical protein
MSKKTVSNAILKEMIVRLQIDNYKFCKNLSNHEVSFFIKEIDTIRLVVTYTVSGRGSYSAFGTITVIYKELTRTLSALLANSPFAQDYDLDNQANVLAGVGVRSEVGKYATDNTTYYCASEAEAKEFALNFSRQIKSEEDNFAQPHRDLAVTLKQFNKPMHAFWPGPLKVFLEHLVATGIQNADPEMIQYAFRKADDVCNKLVPEACPTAFISLLKQRVGQLDFMQDPGLHGEG